MAQKTSHRHDTTNFQLVFTLRPSYSNDGSGRVSVQKADYDVLVPRRQDIAVKALESGLPERQTSLDQPLPFSFFWFEPSAPVTSPLMAACSQEKRSRFSQVPEKPDPLT